MNLRDACHFLCRHTHTDRVQAADSSRMNSYLRLRRGWTLSKHKMHVGLALLKCSSYRDAVCRTLDQNINIKKMELNKNKGLYFLDLSMFINFSITL